MIHRRFNHTRHLVWAAFLLTLFVSSAATHRHKGLTTAQQQMAAEKIAIVNIVAVK